MIKLTKTTYPLSSQANHSESQTREEDQILHLKRLLVTLKQQYEKNLQLLNDQFHAEVVQRESLQQSYEKIKNEALVSAAQHEEELKSLQQQQVILRDFLKKSQEEVKAIREEMSRSSGNADLTSSQQRIEQLERVIPYLRERTEEANLETEQLREELELSYQKNHALEEELIASHKKYEKQIQELHLSLRAQTFQNVESVFNEEKEFDQDKKTLLENVCYADLIKEKISLDQQIKQLQQQLERQSSNLIAFREQLQEADIQKREIELQLHQKEALLQKANEEIKELSSQIASTHESLIEKNELQEHYEQLKEEYLDINERLEEALDSRIQAESNLYEALRRIEDQSDVMSTQEKELSSLRQERENIAYEAQQQRLFLEEHESRLKTAQQHLAKKMKEAALLSEQVDKQHVLLLELQQQYELAKTQAGHLQNNIEMYQKQEKKLQEQLHDALKATESQVAKWEEKYFKMYDKWQESEAAIRELKKFEEKHHQMQSLLTNLGTFMGSSQPISPLFQQIQESMERPGRPPQSLEENIQSSSSTLSRPDSASDERYDLFGMKHPLDKSKSNPSS